MRIYSIFEPASGAVRLDDPGNVIFLKEGFCWPALFIPLPWLLYHRMWRYAAGYSVLSIVLGMLGQALGSQQAAAAMIGLGFGLIVAFEANGWRCDHLLRSAYRQVASVAEKDLPLAEARYFGLRPVMSPVQEPASAPVPGPVFERRASAPQGAWGFMTPDQRR